MDEAPVCVCVRQREFNFTCIDAEGERRAGSIEVRRPPVAGSTYFHEAPPIPASSRGKFGNVHCHWFPFAFERLLSTF